MSKSPEELEEFFKSLPIKVDTDWVVQPTSRPRRGIIDNARDITFERELSNEELVNLRQYLAGDALAREKGWTGVSGYKLKQTPDLPEGMTYHFSTTWDSSD